MEGTGDMGVAREKAKRIGAAIEKFADRALLVLCFFIFGALTFYSMRYTETFHPGTEIPLTVPDSIGRNLLALLGATLALFIAGGLWRRILTKDRALAEKRLRIAVGAATAYVAVVSIVWAAISHVGLRADGEMVSALASLALKGDYSFMLPGRYVCYYPHQLNLLAVVQILYFLFGADNYQAFQYMNALCMPLLFFSGYRILRLIYEKTEVLLYYIVLFVSFIPLFLYVPSVYGEITSITFTMVLMWQVIRYCRTGKKICFLWGTLAIVAAYLMRPNSLIVLVAAGIVLFFHILREGRVLALGWILVMLLAVSGTRGAVQAFYEGMSGQEVSEGFPYVAWTLMGLKDGPCGPGWHDQTDCDEFALYDFDAERMAEDSSEKLAARLKELWEDKAYSVDFFRRKILSQWNAPLYHSYMETKVFDSEVLPEPVHRVYYEDEAAINDFMDRYQFILYFYATVMTVMSLFGRGQERPLENRILLIAIVGGFLFHAFWEAMGRYALPYAVYMIPLAAIGMGQLRERLSYSLNRLRHRRP